MKICPLFEIAVRIIFNKMNIYDIKGGNQKIRVSGGRISGKQYIRIFFIYDLRPIRLRLGQVYDFLF